VNTDFVLVVSTHPLLVSTQCFKHYGEYRFCLGSVDTPLTGVDTVFQTLRQNDEEKKTCLAVLDSVSTLPELVLTLVTLPREPILPVWDSVSTYSEVVSTHSG
ncbi:hypothetical protein Taro_002446, partial [Colocasia esculenta]|nr:hypothetical protein [Colocasia esculenta]